ncbi:hypothetical protein [Haematobacter massiliensis]|nr:hypothetical protein [Haematobacter massiliensis]OWJ84634.1 hypothetical protein CDV51_13170 [Haematobacter massiliensis]QBJ26404.1 hypothetical protein HmaOT1_18925 [Haematobacter massiliensis]
MQPLIATAPYRYCPETRTIWGQGETEGEVMVSMLRGWGHLTGKGATALGLPVTAALDVQHATGRLIVTLLNQHFAQAAALGTGSQEDGA